MQQAKTIAAFPQLCMRSDRRSAYTQWGLSLDAALQNEFSNSLPALVQETQAGASRFASG